MKLKLSDSQLNKIADIIGDIGLIFVAAVVLPALLDKFKPLSAVLGLLAALIFWIITLVLLKGKSYS